MFLSEILKEIYSNKAKEIIAPNIQVANYLDFYPAYMLQGKGWCDALAILPNGFLSSVFSLDINIWDWKNKFCVQTLTITDTEVYIGIIVALPNGCLAYPHRDSIRIWNWENNSFITIAQGNKAIDIILLSNDLLAFAIRGTTIIKIWDWKKNICVKTLRTLGKYYQDEEYKSKIQQIFRLPDGFLACIIGSLAKCIYIWNWENDSFVHDLPLSDSYNTRNLVLMPNGFLVCGDKEHRTPIIRIWDWRNKSCIQKLSYDGHGVCRITVLTDGLLASGDWDGTIRIWDWRNSSCLQTFRHTSDVSSLVLLPDGSLAVGGKGSIQIRRGTIRTINSTELSTVLEALEANNSVTSVNLAGLYLIQKNLQILVRLLKSNKNITSINLNNTSLNDEKAQILLNVLKQNYVLTDLDITGNNINGNLIIQIRKCLCRNSGCPEPQRPLPPTPLPRVIKSSPLIDLQKKLQSYQTETSQIVRLLRSPEHFPYLDGIVKQQIQTLVQHLQDNPIGKFKTEGELKREIQFFALKIDCLRRISNESALRRTQRAREQLEQAYADPSGAKLKALMQEQQKREARQQAEREVERSSLVQQLRALEARRQKQIAEVQTSGTAALTAVQIELKREITNTRNEIVRLGNRIANIESYAAKEREKQRILDGFRQKPNLFEYYHAMRTTLELIFIGSKAAASSVVNVAPAGRVATVEKAVSFFGGLAEVIPVAGGAIKTTLGVVSAGLQEVDKQRQNNTVKYISSLVTLSELMEVTELVAIKLTLCYARQICRLATLEDIHNQQQEGNAKDFVKGVTQRVLKAAEYQPAAQFAEFGVLWMIDALIDMEIDPKQPLHDQLLSVVMTHKSPTRLSALKEHLLVKCGVGVVQTRDGKIWHLSDMYIKCGVETETGALYANDGPHGPTDTATYDYCITSKEVAETRGLFFVGNRKKTTIATDKQATQEKHAVHAAIANQGHKVESMEERVARLEQQISIATLIATLKDRADQSYTRAKTHIKLGEKREAFFALNEAKRLYKQLQKDHGEDISVRLEKIVQKSAALSR